LWCAWWTGEPTEASFRPPDAWSGGARTEEEAKAQAEEAAGAPLRPIEGRWAGAWVRVRAGQAPFVARIEHPSGSGRAARTDGPHALLGIAPGASLEAIKAAFRRKALEHHPDHGGDPAAFIAIKRAYDGIVRRRARKAR
jgi:hypothetical protein